ncbi:MAG TPA: hypothetical protein VFV34_09080 [Blastocatellia bacterium]|nr:hypothetical protein [Blastocatellia bacterium]
MISTLVSGILFAAVYPSYQSQTEPQREPWPLIPVRCKWRKIPENIFPTGKKQQEMRNAAIDAQIAQERRNAKPNEALIAELERRKATQVVPADVPRPSDKAYEYKVWVRNTTAKTVATLKWTYIFTDPVSRAELARRSFESKVKIGPGKQKEIVEYSDSSPPLVVSAQAKPNKKASGWEEVVMIERVQFEDGSVWEH